jgi:HSP20 family protein
MITVLYRTGPARPSNLIAETPSNLVSGIVNWRLTVISNVWRPPTDVFETENDYIVRIEIAGMREEDFNLSIDQNTLYISGNRTLHNELRTFFQMEIHTGEFYLEVELPGAINYNFIEAEYLNGFLLISLPKARPHQIQIKQD